MRRRDAIALIGAAAVRPFIAFRVFHGISEDRVTTISGGVTFFVLLALFPGLAGLISLYGLFSDRGYG
jgi:membrane protein